MVKASACVTNVKRRLAVSEKFQTYQN